MHFTTGFLFCSSKRIPHENVIKFTYLLQELGKQDNVKRSDWVCFQHGVDISKRVISCSAMLCVSINKANLFLRNDAIPKQKFDVILMSLLSIREYSEALIKISKKSILFR